MSVIKAPLRNRTKPSRKKIDYEKIERALGILRGKRIQPLKVQRSLRDSWK